MSRTYKDAQRFVASNMSKRLRQEERLQAQIEQMLWEVSGTPELFSKPLRNKLAKKQAQLKSLLKQDAHEVFALAIGGN